MIKRLFLDTETTGIDPKRHGVFNIAGIIIYDAVYKEFDLFCDIFKEDEFDVTTIEKHGYNEKQLRKLPNPHDTFEQFISILEKYVNRYDKNDKFYVHGYFANFDSEFMRHWFLNNNNQYFGSWFWHPWIDVATFAAYYLMVSEKRPHLPNFQLATIARYLNIPVDDSKTHTALYDAKLAMEIYNICLGSGRNTAEI